MVLYYTPHKTNEVSVLITVFIRNIFNTDRILRISNTVEMNTVFTNFEVIKKAFLFALFEAPDLCAV